jgi:hypothetical protein
VPKKPTTADAQAIMQLYDLRREEEMRKARNWFVTAFWPQSADDIIKIASNFPSQENAWFRQVGGYWDMAAAMVLSGALNEELFFNTNGEMWFTLSKVYPYLKEVREKMQAPEAYAHMEKLATRTKAGRERLERTIQRVASFRSRVASAKAS